jgi:hypothetical protein
MYATTPHVFRYTSSSQFGKLMEVIKHVQMRAEGAAADNPFALIRAKLG